LDVEHDGEEEAEAGGRKRQSGDAEEKEDVAREVAAAALGRGTPGTRVR
jgi:hypothetical protein